MIEEKDLRLLILIEEKLIEVNSDSIPVTMGDFKDIFIDRSHFNNIARILVKHNLAKELISKMPNIVAIIKTDLTRYKRIQDIFNEEQNSVKSKLIEAENILLTNESLKHQKTIIDQEQKIRNLTEENLKLSNSNFRKYILHLFIAATIGVIVENIMDISKYASSLYLQVTQEQKPKQAQPISERTKTQTNQISNKKNDSTTNK